MGKATGLTFSLGKVVVNVADFEIVILESMLLNFFSSALMLKTINLVKFVPGKAFTA